MVGKYIVSTLIEWISKVVTPDGPSLHLVYIMVVDLVLVLNIEIIMYRNVTLNYDHYEQLFAKCRLISYAMFLNG
jgi:hypothetical protein